MKKYDFQIVFKRPLSTVDREWERLSDGICLALSNGFRARNIQMNVSRVNLRVNWQKNEVSRIGSILEIPMIFEDQFPLEMTSGDRAKALWSAVLKSFLLFKRDLSICDEDIEYLNDFVISRNFGAVVVGKKQRNENKASQIKWARVEVHVYPENSELYIRCGISNRECISRVAIIGSNYFEWRRYFVDLVFSEKEILLATQVFDGVKDSKVQYRLMVADVL